MLKRENSVSITIQLYMDPSANLIQSFKTLQSCLRGLSKFRRFHYQFFDCDIQVLCNSRGQGNVAGESSKSPEYFLSHTEEGLERAMAL